MKIIAFDLGAHMAWAHNVEGRLLWGNKIYAGARAERLGHTLLEVSQLLQLPSMRLAVLVYETPFARGRDATRSLWGIAGVLEACAHNANMAVLDVAVPTIKKFATGDGRAPKDVMIEAARKFGYKAHNEHEADAICLLKYAEAHLEKGDGK